MSLSSLASALSGLQIAQQQINVISTNVANVGTPGYTRKILPQSSQAINGVTVGVMPETIIRQVDINLERDLWTQTSRVSFYNVRESYLSRVEQFHGPPDAEKSVAAEVARLRDSFSALSNSPEDTFLLAAAVEQAQDTADKINDLSNLITTMRNDVQEDMSNTVEKINALLEQIAELNDQIRGNINVGRTSAQMADLRSEAIKELSGLIDVSYFQRGDGVIVVQTNRGVELASDFARPLTFSQVPLSAVNFYPDSGAGIFVGDPLSDPAAVDITTFDPGGKLGGLIDLRDKDFPQQMAQLDELAHKMALRFEAQGLMLFTDASGTIPADTPPDTTAGPPELAVSYVGFSTTMRVNVDVLANHSLVQQGTAGASIPTGSSEVIRRVIEFTFGSIDYQEAIGAIDMRVSGFAPPNDTLQNFLGVDSSNTITGTTDLAAYLTVADLVTAANGALDDPNDQFQITFEEARTGLGPTTITVDLSVADTFPGGDATTRLMNHINNEIALAGVPAGLAAVASVGSNGELVIDSTGTIQIDASFGPTGVGSAGLVFLGLGEGTTPPEDPYFDIRVGNNDPVRIMIEPGDDENDLMTKLGAVPGLAVEDITLSADGFLRLRPGNDYTDPDFGGNIQIIGGPFTTSGAGANAVFGAGTIPDDLNIVSGLFGSFTTGPTQDQSPVQSIGYRSETENGSGVFVPFRETLLGPGVDIQTGVRASTMLIDYAQKMINQQSQEIALTDTRIADEEALRSLLEIQLLDDSGVNLDEELGHLIVVQTAYSASARVISAVDEQFQELLRALG